MNETISSQKPAGNAEGAKRPTAGDEGCEVRAQNLAPLLHPEGGRVPPFIEKFHETINQDTDFAVQNARYCLYLFYSRALSDPLSERFCRLLQPDFLEMAVAAAEFLAGSVNEGEFVLAPGERPVSMVNLQPLQEFFVGTPEYFTASYQSAFGLLMSRECPPYETEYCRQTFSIFRSQELADIAGFYMAFGVEPSRDPPERQDHIALELEFMSWLIFKNLRAESSGNPESNENAVVCREAQKNFFEKHMVWWIPAFCAALELKADRASGESFYGRVARSLSAFIGLERYKMNIEPPTELVASVPDTGDAEMECGACDASFGEK